MNYKESQLLYTIIGGVLQSENVVGFSAPLLERLETYFNELEMDYEDIGSTKIFLLSQFGEQGEDGKILLRDKKEKEKYDENFKYFMELDVDHGGIDFSEDEWKEFTEVSGLPQDVLEGARPLMLKKEEEAPVKEPKKEIGLLLKEERKPRKSKKNNYY